MSKTTLVVLAAGIGARYGKGIKQLEPVGPNGLFVVEARTGDLL